MMSACISHQLCARLPYLFSHSHDRSPLLVLGLNVSMCGIHSDWTVIFTLKFECRGTWMLNQVPWSLYATHTLSGWQRGASHQACPKQPQYEGCLVIKRRQVQHTDIPCHPRRLLSIQNYWFIYRIYDAVILASPKKLIMSCTRLPSLTSIY